jgi:hypothetical protein
MSQPSDARLLVLHGLRLKGVVPVDGLAQAAGLPVAEVDSTLDALADERHVVLRTGALVGWSLTPAGRRELDRLLADEVDAVGARDAVTGAYRRFRALNAGVLDACSRWQVRDVDGRPVVNDHSDAAYDAAVVADLARLQQAADPVCDDLAATLDRYEPYGPALRRAVPATTRSGSNCTKTCWRRSASTAPASPCRDTGRVHPPHIDRSPLDG